MATKIEWAGDVWNVCTGCSKVSRGCERCYAESMAKRFWKGRKFTDVQCHPERMMIPVRRKKPTDYFVCSMSDLFHDAVCEGFIGDVLDTIEYCPQHTFTVLTKRAERMCRLVALRGDVALPNLILGVSAEDQTTFDERVPLLLKTPAACRLISMEPLLGPIKCYDKLDGIGWVILGGESGAGARMMDTAWPLPVWRECELAGVPFFFKQYGTAAARRLNFTGKGGNPAEWLMDWPRRFPAMLKGKT